MPGRQREPDVEAAVRDVPPAGRRHHVVEGVDHRVAALAVHLPELLDLALPVVRGEVGRDRHLRELRRAERRGLLGQHQLLAHRVRRERPADPEPGREGLGERAEVDHALGLVGPQRAQRLAVEAEQAVGVVLEDEDVLAPADVQDLRPPGDRERHAGRVVEVGDRVEELDLLAGRPGRRDRLLQRLGHQPVGVHLGVHDVALVGLEDPERPDVGRGLADHHVAGVAEHPGDQVDRLLRADGDHHVVGVRLDPLEPHHLGDLLAERGHPLAGAVLHRLGAVVGDQVTDRAADHVEGQAGDVGHPAGQRDHLGPRGHREQGPDLGGRHPCGARGVAVDVGVEAVQRARGRGVHDRPSMGDNQPGAR